MGEKNNRYTLPFEITISKEMSKSSNNHTVNDNTDLDTDVDTNPDYEEEKVGDKPKKRKAPENEIKRQERTKKEKTSSNSSLSDDNDEPTDLSLKVDHISQLKLPDLQGFSSFYYDVPLSKIRYNYDVDKLKFISNRHVHVQVNENDKFYAGIYNNAGNRLGAVVDNINKYIKTYYLLSYKVTGVVDQHKVRFTFFIKPSPMK
jgi:hypothetical protein